MPRLPQEYYQHGKCDDAPEEQYDHVQRSGDDARGRGIVLLVVALLRELQVDDVRCKIEDRDQEKADKLYRDRFLGR